jgi:hypothetical protein
MILFSKKLREKKRWESKRKALLKEDTFYEKKFDEHNIRYLTAEDVLRKLKEKNISIPRKDELNILVIFKHHNWEKFSLIPALEKFGNVHHFDWSDHIVDIRKFSQKLKINELLVNYFGNLHEMQKIDLIFGYFSGESIEESTLIYFKEKGVPIINLSLNDRELFVGKIRNGKAQGIRDICKHVSISWTSTESAVKKILVEGGTPIYMPEGANPKIHKPYPNEKKVYPVSFVGACYGERAEIIEYLRSKNIDIHTFGKGWPNGEVALEEMVKIYSKTHVNLGFSGVGKLNGEFCLKGRDFEVTMSGGLYLTQHNKEIPLFFDTNLPEILTWHAKEDLLLKINNLLKRPKLCQDIALRGHKKALNSHTWESRFDRLVNLLTC